MKLNPPSLSNSATTAAPPIVLDDSQQAAIAGALAQEHTGASLIIGAPGTGKTTVVIELVKAAVEQGIDPEKILVLSATRRSAGQLRNVVAQSIAGPIRGAIVRTAAAAAFSILTAQASSQGDPAPRLITGPEQDQLLGQILQGHQDGLVPGLNWPPSIPEETLGLRGFRAELRDLFMRAAENGLGPEDLDALGREHGRPDWSAAAKLLSEYEAITTLQTVTPDAGRRYDPAQIIDDGAYALSTWQGPRKPGWDLVIVDDYQEATAATARLLSVLARDGSQLVLVGDPDVAVQGFRGAMPALLGRAGAGQPGQIHLDPQRLGEFAAPRFVLENVWRAGAQLRTITTAVTQTIASVGQVAHRRAAAAVASTRLGTDDAGDGRSRGPAHPDRGDNTGSTSELIAGCEVHVVPTEVLQDALVANVLRTESLLHNVSWSQMAVVCRSGGDIARLRRSLAFAGVPVEIVGADIALRDEPAVRPLLVAMRGAGQEELEIETALDLLTSPIGGLDGIGLRRLRRALRSEELEHGGGRNSDALILEALAHPGFGATIADASGAALRRVARVLDAGHKALEQTGATAQTVLWAVWDAAQLAQTWQNAAVLGGPGAARADRDLDSVMALFRAAENYVDRMPQAHPQSFVDFITAQDLPADNLASGGQQEQVVSLVTPAGAAGRQWDLVVVAGVQDGSWPDLRLRDSLLGSQTLVELLSGRATDAKGLGPQARKAVLYDELRAFVVAVSRSTRRLVITAVDDGETLPSVFLDLVSDLPGVQVRRSPQSDHVSAAGEAPLTLRGLVGVLRGEHQSALLADDTDRARERAELLAYLTTQGVKEADPTNWYGTHEVSATAQLFSDDAEIRVSPSRLEAVETCALRWMLETSGGQPAQGLSQSVGTLIHEIAAKFPSGTLPDLRQELDLRWEQLKLPEGWPSRRQKAHAEVMLAKLAQYFRDAPKRGQVDVAVEQNFTVTIGRAVMSGSADRLEFLADGSVRIVDLKTGKSAPTKEETQANPQLGAYQVAALAQGFGEGAAISAGASLLYVATPTKSPTIREQDAITDPEENWAKTMIVQAAEVMASNCFTAKTNPMCRVCPVRRSCPLQTEGQHIVPPSAPSLTVESDDV
ncbi:ATP-dependent DNA helicase [Jonesiaceae bacterium BS-20]|uniref:DNA 3'-5' helicase n=1 Tax=Jonesiaceae bacterium BS-20 TaxID=3120821 RepID=A0AAU7DZK1_9MICO